MRPSTTAVTTSVTVALPQVGHRRHLQLDACDRHHGPAAGGADDARAQPATGTQVQHVAVAGTEVANEIAQLFENSADTTFKP